MVCRMCFYFMFHPACPYISPYQPCWGPLKTRHADREVVVATMCITCIFGWKQTEKIRHWSWVKTDSFWSYILISSLCTHSGNKKRHSSLAFLGPIPTLIKVHCKDFNWLQWALDQLQRALILLSLKSLSKLPLTSVMQVQVSNEYFAIREEVEVHLQYSQIIEKRGRIQIAANGVARKPEIPLL